MIFNLKEGGICFPYKEKPGCIVILEREIASSPEIRLHRIRLTYEAFDNDSMALLNRTASLIFGDQPLFWGNGKDKAVWAILRNFNIARESRGLPSLGIAHSPHADMPGNFQIYQAIISKYLPQEAPPLLILPDDSQVRMALVNLDLGAISEVKEEPAIAALGYALFFLDSQQPIYFDRERKRQTRAITDYDMFDF